MVEGLGVGLIHMMKKIETIKTEAGPVQVADDVAPRFEALIKDFVAHGYIPHRMGGYATHGHVSHSLHYSGHAVDFDQCGWGCTVGFMKSHIAAALIAEHGFRNGCSFGDCGHVDTGFGYRSRKAVTVAYSNRKSHTEGLWSYQHNIDNQYRAEIQ